MSKKIKVSLILFFLLSILFIFIFFYINKYSSEKGVNSKNQGIQKRESKNYTPPYSFSKNSNLFLRGVTYKDWNLLVMVSLRDGLPVVFMSLDQGKTWIKQNEFHEDYKDYNKEISEIRNIIIQDGHIILLAYSVVKKKYYILRTKIANGRYRIKYPEDKYVWESINLLGSINDVSNLIFAKGLYFLSWHLETPELLKNEYKNYFIYADTAQDSMEWHYNWKNYSNTLQPFLIRFYSLAFGNDTLVAVGSSIPTSPTIDFSDIKNYKGLIVRSADGKNWNEVTNKNLGFLHQVHFVNGAFYALDLQGGIYKSKDDGKTWLLVYSNPKFVFTKVVGRDATNSPENIPTLTSKNFNNRDSGDNVSMSINNVGMIAIGGSQETGGVLLRSQDNGETWKLEKEFPNTYISDSIYSLNQNKFIIIGNGFNNGAPVYLMLE